MHNAQKADGGSKSIIQFDLFKGTPLQFVEVTEEFEKHRRTLSDPSPINQKNGWYTITPQLAEEYLCRNIKGANREAHLADVYYYARQMKKGDWVKTGEAICFDKAGRLLNGQHRLWACYLSETNFDSFVIFDVPVNPIVFAFYDNGAKRNAATALKIGGFDGVSPLISGMIKIRESVNHGAYTMQRTTRLERLAPVEVLRIAQADPKLKEGARLAAGEYRAAMEIIGNKNVAGYLAYRIISIYNETVLEDFMRDLESSEGEIPDDNATVALRKCLEADRKKEHSMPGHLVLAHCIKAFNAWKKEESVKKLRIPVTDDFPTFVEEESAMELAIAE